MEVSKHLVVAMLTASFGLAGCGDDSTPTMDAGGADASPPDSAMDAPMACPTPSSGPTTHSGAISADETWTADASPHIIMGNVQIEGDATLTIEPCAVVQLSSHRQLSAGSSSASGHLVAEGTASAPIRFERAEDTPWEYLMVGPTGSARLAYVTLTGGGGDAVTYDGASLVATGPSDRPYVQNLFVDHVTISGSAGYGVLMRRYSAFMTGATDLSVVDSGASDADHLAPVRIDAEAVTTLPTGSYTGNASDEIEVDPFPAVRSDTTFPDRGVPYHVMSSDGLTVARADTTGPVPTLTIEAGVTVTFDSGARLDIGKDTTEHSRPGALIVQGTAETPVTLTSSSTTPAAADWQGIGFATPPDPATDLIDYATIEYAGSRNAIGGYSCTANDSAGSLLLNDAAVFIYSWMPTSAFVTHSTITDSGGWGVLRGWKGDAIDFTPTNTFARLAHCEQSDPRAADGSCTGEPLTYACADAP